MVQGLLGQEVVVAVEHPQTGYEPLNVLGVLLADDDITEPFSEGRFDFTVGAGAGALSLDRAFYRDATEVDEGLRVESGSAGSLIIVRIALIDALEGTAPADTR